MVLVIDNSDSFTYNLVQCLGELGATPLVRRNDRIRLDEMAALRPARVVISPGPGRPQDAGMTIDIVRRFGETIPILGICLGHQAIGVAFGGRITRAARPLHGKTSTICHDGRGVFTDLPYPILAARYHSLIVDPNGLPECLEVSARAQDDEAIMGVRHCEWPVEGVQFHPESIMTAHGKQLLRNFLDDEGVAVGRSRARPSMVGRVV